MKLKLNRLIFYLLAILFLIFMGLEVLPTFFYQRELPLPKCKIELASMNTAIEVYQAAYGEVPKGGLAEIMKCLLGENPRKIKFISVSAKDLNKTGEFLDPWGTPFFINHLSSNNFIISSAGKNKVFGDIDDIVFISATNDFLKP